MTLYWACAGNAASNATSGTQLSRTNRFVETQACFMETPGNIRCANLPHAPGRFKAAPPPTAGVARHSSHIPRPASVQALVPQQRVDPRLAAAEGLEAVQRAAAAAGLEHGLAVAAAG